MALSKQSRPPMAAFRPRASDSEGYRGVLGRFKRSSQNSVLAHRRYYVQGFGVGPPSKRFSRPRIEGHRHSRDVIGAVFNASSRPYIISSGYDEVTLNEIGRALRSRTMMVIHSRRLTRTKPAARIKSATHLGSPLILPVTCSGWTRGGAIAPARSS